MSVLKARRSESKAQYINTAFDIQVNVLNFLTRLSSRYSRLLAQNVANLAFEIIDNAEKANSVGYNDDIRAGLREKYLLRARASLDSLDIQLTLCYDVISQNPQGAYNKANGKSMPSSEAIQKIDNIATRLGNMINDEKRMLNALLKHDYKQQKKLNKEED